MSERGFESSRAEERRVGWAEAKKGSPDAHRKKPSPSSGLSKSLLALPLSP